MSTLQSRRFLLMAANQVCLERSLLQHRHQRLPNQLWQAEVRLGVSWRGVPAGHRVPCRVTYPLTSEERLAVRLGTPTKDVQRLCHVLFLPGFCPAPGCCHIRCFPPRFPEVLAALTPAPPPASRERECYQRSCSYLVSLSFSRFYGDVTFENCRYRAIENNGGTVR